MQHSEQIDKITAAMLKVQGGIGIAKKDCNNPFFNSKYADLASVWDACRDILGENDLAIIQGCSIPTGQGVIVNTMLIHSSGQWFKSELFLPIPKADPQSVGSAITYGRRYLLSTMVGVIADIDDDAEGAMGRQQPAKSAPRAKVKPKADTRPASAPQKAPEASTSTTLSPEKERAILDRLKSSATDTVNKLHNAIGGGSSGEVRVELQYWYKANKTAIKTLSKEGQAEIIEYCANGAQP